MDREVWAEVLRAIKRAARKINKLHPMKRKPPYSDWLIVAMYLWAVAHERSQSWACERDHYNGMFRPRQPLPSVSQFNRRLRWDRTEWILQEIQRQESGGTAALASSALSYLDGKPLLVGVASKDRAAKRGHVMGGMARGYKLHAWMSEDRRIPLWSVMPLNVAEPPVATLLVSQLNEPLLLRDDSLMLVDQNFDSYQLHKQVAARNGRLLVPPKGEGKSLAQRHPVNLRKMGAARRELIAVTTTCPSLVHMVYRQRVNAEGIFGNLCGYGGGLTHLPPWVRGLHRVRRWVGGKIILYHARLRVRARRKRAA